MQSEEEIAKKKAIKQLKKSLQSGKITHDQYQIVIINMNLSELFDDWRLSYVAMDTPYSDSERLLIKQLHVYLHKYSVTVNKQFYEKTKQMMENKNGSYMEWIKLCLNNKIENIM